MPELRDLKDQHDIARLDSGDDEDGQEENEREESDSESIENGMLMWCGPTKKNPVIMFRADSVVVRNPQTKNIGAKYRLAFKMSRGDSKIVRTILLSHGFHEVHPNSADFNVMWIASHVKPYVLRTLTEHQKVNHFPRSYEITRKDRLYKNIQRMQLIRGFRHFNFIPPFFVTPIEFQDFQAAFIKDKGPWIVKPIASSRGRGVYLVNHPNQVPTDETLIVAKYIPNPLLVDDFKFDMRIYVAVTSMDPLIIYVYEEGLARFATVKFDRTMRNLRNQCMHLTNYSINKKNGEFVRCDNADIEDYGNKWSLGAMMRYLRREGHDTSLLMLRIEDVIVKTLISGEVAMATAAKMFQPYRGNCFELFGFDILVDESLKPWVLEVNLSPSLNCDSPMDLKIKANMISDLLSLTGVVAQDPISKRVQQQRKTADIMSRGYSRRARPKSATTTTSSGQPAFNIRPVSAANHNHDGGSLSNEEMRIVRRAREEFRRRGGWIRIFPHETSLEMYAPFMEHKTTYNLMLHQRLFPGTATRMMPSGGAHINRPMLVTRIILWDI